MSKMALNLQVSFDQDLFLIKLAIVGQFILWGKGRKSCLLIIRYIKGKNVSNFISYVKQKLPMGRLEWNIPENICRDQLSTRTLFFSACMGLEFACRNGACVDAEKRLKSSVIIILITTFQVWRDLWLHWFIRRKGLLAFLLAKREGILLQWNSSSSIVAVRREIIKYDWR